MAIFEPREWWRRVHWGVLVEGLVLLGGGGGYYACRGAGDECDQRGE